MIIVEEDKYVIEINIIHESIMGSITQLENVNRLCLFNIIRSRGYQNLNINYDDLDKIDIVNNLVLKIYDRYGRNY